MDEELNKNSKSLNKQKVVFEHTPPFRKKRKTPVDQEKYFGCNTCNMDRFVKRRNFYDFTNMHNNSLRHRLNEERLQNTTTTEVPVDSTMNQVD